ncbi:hydrogenase maturation protease [bacterium]|nr:hydrogenase maturation protease [bacterium]MBU1883002.1 hydrogenase maturation protease [bacterium]
MKNKIAVIGSGNAFFKDEGVGLYAVKYIKENYDFTPAIEFVDGGTLGFLLMPLLQEYEEVIIVNTGSEDDKVAGTISIKDCDEFLDGTLIKKTANEVEIAEMLQICSLTENMAKTILISIAPEDIISVEVGLTTTLQDVWEDYIKAILETIQNCKIEISKRESSVSLADILHTFAYPSIEHNRGF